MTNCFPPLGERLGFRNLFFICNLLRILESLCQIPRGLRGAQKGSLLLIA
jgi:hypothetical protein